jgi:hypothetical protein
MRVDKKILILIKKVNKNCGHKNCGLPLERAYRRAKLKNNSFRKYFSFFQSSADQQLNLICFTYKELSPHSIKG